MERKYWIITGIVVLLVLLLVFLCFLPRIRLHAAMRPYTDAVSGALPESLRLTICYIDPLILTRKPMLPEELLRDSTARIITVEAEELEKHRTLLQALTPAELTPVKQKGFLNVRLYYIFETDAGKLLDVAFNGIHDCPFVNGIEVEDNDLFYELIDPFLTDEDRGILYKQFQP